MVLVMCPNPLTTRAPPLMMRHLVLLGFYSNRLPVLRLPSLMWMLVTLLFCSRQGKPHLDHDWSQRRCLTSTSLPQARIHSHQSSGSRIRPAYIACPTLELILRSQTFNCFLQRQNKTLFCLLGGIHTHTHTHQRTSIKTQNISVLPNCLTFEGWRLKQSPSSQSIVSECPFLFRTSSRLGFSRSAVH